MCIAKHLGNKETRGFAAAITVLWFCLWPSFRRSTSSSCNTTVFQSLYWLKERVLFCTIICLFSWLGNSSLLQLRLRWKYYMIRYALRVCWLKFIQFFVFPLYLFIYTVKQAQVRVATINVWVIKWLVERFYWRGRLGLTKTTWRTFTGLFAEQQERSERRTSCTREILCNLIHPVFTIWTYYILRRAKLCSFLIVLNFFTVRTSASYKSCLKRKGTFGCFVWTSRFGSVRFVMVFPRFF